MARDYYLILGVGSDATPNQIKSAYRQKAKSVHPDCSGGECEPFLDVQQAYEVLSDPARRKIYDAELARTRRARRRSRELEPEPLIPPQRHAVQNPLYSPPTVPLFHEILDHMWDDFEPWASSRPSRDQEIHIEINLTGEQARRGGNVRVWLPVQVICPACRGQGQDWFFRCPHCRGSGTTEKELLLPISFPAQVSNGTMGRLPLDQFGYHHTSLIVHFRVRW